MYARLFKPDTCTNLDDNNLDKIHVYVKAPSTRAIFMWQFLFARVDDEK